MEDNIWMDNFENLFIGAYATSPTLFKWDEDKEREYFSNIKNSLNLKGIEIPFYGELHEYNEELFLSLLDSKWEYILTSLPGTIKRLESNLHFGIASDDEKGRLEAIDFYKKANDVIKRINDYFGTQKVISMVLASAPSLKSDKISSSSKSLIKSLNEIVKWDWFGTKLVIEHCDSGREINPVKGFLSLDEEIEAISEVNKKITNPIGLTINWGRSAIEMRSARGPVEHVRKAFQNNVLSGLMFSGTSPKSELYGEWSDLHLPIGKESGLKYYEVDSIMNSDSIKNTLKECNLSLLSYIGVKVLSMPIENSSIEKRIGTNRDTLKVLNQVIKRSYEYEK